jgi:hypothetical protein
MNRCFVRTVCASVIAATMSVSFPGVAAARLIGTEEAVRTGPAAAGMTGDRHAIDRDSLRALFERDDVRRQLEALGVDPRQARERVEAMTDGEIERLAGQVGTLPAGGDGGSILGFAFAVFLILLITDILGLTKIFPFTRSIR